MRVEIHDEGFKPLQIVIETRGELMMFISTLDYAVHYLKDKGAHKNLQVWIEDLRKELQ